MATKMCCFRIPEDVCLSMIKMKQDYQFKSYAQMICCFVRFFKGNPEFIKHAYKYAVFFKVSDINQ